MDINSGNECNNTRSISREKNNGILWFKRDGNNIHQCPILPSTGYLRKGLLIQKNKFNSVEYYRFRKI
jgi:hypothetical protein